MTAPVTMPVSADQPLPPTPTIVPRNFLLSSETAERIYRSIADLPINDFHNHLPLDRLHEDRPWKNATEFFIRDKVGACTGDHYLIQQIRGRIPADPKLPDAREDFLKNAPDKQLFLKFAEILPNMAGSPDSIWFYQGLASIGLPHLEVNENTAEQAWTEIETALALPRNRPRALLERCKTAVLCTIDDPAESLATHQALKDDLSLKCCVRPTFRPDRFLLIADFGSEPLSAKAQKNFFNGIDALQGIHTPKIESLGDMLQALTERMDYFQSIGCRSADQSFPQFPLVTKLDFDAADKLFQKIIKEPSTLITRAEFDNYLAVVLHHLAKEYAKRDFVMQLHQGPVRNANSNVFRLQGADAGGDIPGRPADPIAVKDFFDRLDLDGGIPTTMVFPIAGGFTHLQNVLKAFAAKSGIPIQVGPPWWHKDSFEGFHEFFEAMRMAGKLGDMIGMLCDSRSYPTIPGRHDLFRRVLSSYLANAVNLGAMTYENAERIARRAAFDNSHELFGVAA